MESDQPTEITSAEARALREENLRNTKRLHDKLVDVSEENTKQILHAFLRASQEAAVREQRAEIARLQTSEALRRIEERQLDHDERFSAIASAMRRDHDSLSKMVAQADAVEPESINPWFLRPVAWRPILIASVLAVVLSTITACATVHMLAPTPEAVDAGKPAPSASHGSP